MDKCARVTKQDLPPQISSPGSGINFSEGFAKLASALVALGRLFKAEIIARLKRGLVCFPKMLRGSGNGLARPCWKAQKKI